jgi:hypothetical protein
MVVCAGPCVPGQRLNIKEHILLTVTKVLRLLRMAAAGSQSMLQTLAGYRPIRLCPFQPRQVCPEGCASSTAGCSGGQHGGSDDCYQQDAGTPPSRRWPLSLRWHGLIPHHLRCLPGLPPSCSILMCMCASCGQQSYSMCLTSSLAERLPSK